MILIREKVWRRCPTSSLPNCNSGSSNGTSSQVHHHRFFTESITGAKGPPGMHTRRRTSADKAPNTEGKCHKPATSSITPELCCISPGTITTLMIRKSNKERMKNGNMSICVGEDAQKTHLQRSKPLWTILMEWANSSRSISTICSHLRMQQNLSSDQVRKGRMHTEKSRVLLLSNCKTTKCQVPKLCSNPAANLHL